jgi:hypothetical protein
MENTLGARDAECVGDGASRDGHGERVAAPSPDDRPGGPGLDVDR